MTLSFFYGDEEYLIEQEIKKLKNKLLDKSFSAMNFKSVKNLNYQDFISLLRTQPMMFGNQMIVINIENFFSNYTFEDYQIEEIKDSLENISPSLNIIFTFVFNRNSKQKPDSRKKIYKIISKYAELKEFASIPSYDTASLISFINKEAKKQNVIFDKQASLKLVEQVGNNLRELVNEIEKLILVAHPKDKITEEMVKNSSITNDDIFSLTNKLLEGKKVTALKEFRKLCDKQYPLQLLSIIQTNLRKAVILKLNEKRLSNKDLSKLTGYTEYQIPHKINNLKNISLKDLAQLKQNFSNAEFNIKSGKSLDIQSEIENAFFI